MNATPPPIAVSAKPEVLYRAGTLVYTKAGLAAVFFWLLWGEFVLYLIQTLQLTLLPVLLKMNGASDNEIGFIVSTILSIFTAAICPVVSFKSDRTRTRFGRRIPYLMVATPFVALTLGLLPFAPQITGEALKIPLLAKALHAFPVAPVILIFGLLVAAFQACFVVINSVYYYLFRDVIPVNHLGRFMSLFRVFAYLAAFVFNYWIFGKAETHMREIFIGAAIVYALGFLLMCLNLKEGDYLPVEATEKTTGGLKQALRNFVVQSFGAPIYRWIYVTRSLVLAAFMSSTFSVFFARDQLGLGMDQIGKVTAWSALFCLPLAYPFGVLLDRWGSMRVMPLTLWAIILANLAAFCFIHDGRTLLIFGTLTASAQFLFMIAQTVWLNRMFHQERIGQLSSASALILAFFGGLAGPACGLFFGWLKDYRFVYLWTAILTVLAVGSLRKARGYWLKLGGHEHYTPPLPEAPSPAEPN